MLHSSRPYTRREPFNVALRADFITGLPRFARNDDSSCHLAHAGCGRHFRFAIQVFSRNLRLQVSAVECGTLTRKILSTTFKDQYRWGYGRMREHADVERCRTP